MRCNRKNIGHTDKMAATHFDRFMVRLKKFFSVNLYTVPSKIVYSLYGAMIGTHMAFLNIFFTSVGLSTFQAGIITGVRFAAASLVGPLWGALVDYTHRRKLILIVLCLGSAFPIFAMPFVAREIYKLPTNETCYRQTNTSDFSGIEKSIKECKLSLEHDLDTLFYALLSLTVFASIFVVPLQGYIDTIVMNVVKTAPKKASYGAQRIFGSLGFCAANAVSGVVADHFKEPGLSQYTAVFSMFLPITLLLIPTVCYILGQAKWDEEDSKKDMETASKLGKNTSIAKQTLKMFQKFDVIFFMATVLIQGLANNLYLNFAFLLVQDEMHISETMMTLVLVASSLSEIFVFPFTSKLIRLFRGTAPAYTFGMFVFAVRFFVMSFKVEFWVMVLLQTLHCLSFALSWAAIMEHVHIISPEEINVTMNSIMQSLYCSVSALLANMVGGKVYMMYGGRKMFRGKAVICGVWTVFMIIYYGCQRLRKSSKREIEQTVRYKKEESNSAKESEGNHGMAFENPGVEINAIS